MSQRTHSGRSTLSDLAALIDVPRWRVAALCLAAVISVVLSFSPHLFVWWLGVLLLTDGALPDTRSLAGACLALVAALAVRYACAGIASVGSHYLAFDVQFDLRRRLAQKLAAVPMGFLDGQRRGTLRKTALDDIEGLEDGVAHLIPEMTASTVTPVLLIAAMLAMDWRMTLVALAPALLGFVLLGHLMKKGEPAVRRYQDGLAEIGAIAHETVSAFPLVKTFGAGNIVIERARAAFHRFQSETARWIDQALIPSTWFQIVTTATPAAVLPVGVWLHQRQDLDLPTLLFFVIVSIGLGNVFFSLGTLSHRLTNQRDILTRLHALLSEPPLPVAAEPAEPAGQDIRFEAVSFAYDDRTVLDGISFTVSPGESVALVGPSGSGKSTIARLLARFWDVSSGAVRIGGADIRTIAPAALNARVALVFQDVFLFSRSIRDNIRLGRPEAGESEVAAAARAAQAHDFIMALPHGYDTVLAENGGGLSGGQRQRLSIARAILKNAPILVLDEATAYADPQNELQVQSAITALSHGKTVIAIAHRLNTITEMDRIIVLDRGRIVDQGRHEDLLERCGLYRKLWTDHMGASAFTFGIERSSAAQAAVGA